MRITKKQIVVITLLNLVIAALICWLLYLRTSLFKPAAATGDDGGIDDGGGTEVVAPVHDKLRDPTKGKIKEIIYETRLMGSGDESVVFSHTLGGVTYIFGNAVVPDYDFDTSGGFLCRVGADGKILGFTYFDGKLTAAGVAEGGFVASTVKDAGTQNEKSCLVAVTDDGQATPLSELDGRAVDIMAVNGKKMSVVTAIGDGTLKLTEFTRAGTGWAVGNSTRISSGLNIEYFDCYMINDGYVISAHAYSGTRYAAIVFYTFKAGGDAVPHYYGGNDESMVKPYAVLPYGGGYIALCDKGDEAAIVTLDYGFTSYRRDMLGFKFTDASLLYSGGKYYACFVRDDGAVTYELDELLNRKTVTVLNGSWLTAVVNMDSPLFVSATDSAVTITDGADINAILGIADGTINRVVKTGYNEVIIILSARGGSALSDPTGNADVYLISVKL